VLAAVSPQQLCTDHDKRHAHHSGNDRDEDVEEAPAEQARPVPTTRRLAHRPALLGSPSARNAAGNRYLSTGDLRPARKAAPAHAPDQPT
jgi:hypothetical protein